MIFDTTFVIDIMQKDEDAVKKLHELIEKNEPQFVTSPTLFELYSGLAQSQKPEVEKKKIVSVLSDLTILSLDNQAAKKGGSIDGELVKKGNVIGPVDSMIAGIALVKKEKVLTRNTKDFSKVEGLDVEEY